MKKIALVLAAQLLFTGAWAQTSDEALYKKAEEIHKKYLTIDTHNDTAMYLNHPDSEDWSVTKGQVSFPLMKKGGLDAAFFAIYVIMNVIRSFMNSKKSSMAMLVCAYFTMLFVVVCFIVDYASDVRGLFAFKFIPTDLGLVTLILADIFASISRTKKFED